MKTLKPSNQKSVYHSFADLFAKIMDNELEVDRAEVAAQALQGMNRTYALEVKCAELTGETMRIIETKNFDQIPLE